MLSDADVKRLALELAKHSRLQEIVLTGTGCFVIAVWSGGAGARHACEAGWACLKMRDVGRVAVLLVTV